MFQLERPQVTKGIVEEEERKNGSGWEEEEEWGNWKSYTTNAGIKMWIEQETGQTWQEGMGKGEKNGIWIRNTPNDLPPK